MAGARNSAAGAFGTAHSAFHSTAFALAQDVVMLLAIVFWLGLAFWVYRDARRRMDDPWLWGTATALALAAPYLGPLVYLLFRPPETLDDVRSREIELRALEEQLHLPAAQCPLCRSDVQPEFLVCPVCTTQLKQPCVECNAPLDRLWQVCPYCATPVVTAPVASDLDAALTAEVRATRKRASRRSPRSEAAVRAAASARAPAPSAGRRLE